MGTATGTPSMAKRAASSALMGSAVEYYDFTLFATASALFLGPVFFAPLGTGAATMAAFLTFGSAFVARPLGAVLFGHLGDRVGRRAALIWSVTVMGASTTAIGLLPGYAAIGTTAPILLLVLRLLQGLSAGGEQAGSNALSLEHAPATERNRYAAWTMQGTSLGTLLGKLAFLFVVWLPQPTLLAWGWRLPFLVAGPLMLVALVIRRSVIEPPVFTDLAASGGLVRAPVTRVLSRHGRQVLAVAVGTLFAVGGAALNVYGLSFATSRGTSAGSYLAMISVVTALGLVLQPLWARLSDRVGRRPVFIGSCLAAAVLYFAYLPALGSGNLLLVGLGSAAMMTAWTAANATSAAWFAELFPTEVRYSGAALGGQAGMIVVGFAPAIMTSLEPAGWLAVAGFGAGCLLLAATAAWLTAETYTRPLTPAGSRNGR
ncbi:MAG: MFS transporter [Propionibacteriaceae bacterium]|nr:MFS transporter [Propionibacteriaceae bacterium]